MSKRKTSIFDKEASEAFAEVRGKTVEITEQNKKQIAKEIILEVLEDGQFLPPVRVWFQLKGHHHFDLYDAAEVEELLDELVKDGVLESDLCYRRKK